MPLLAALLQDEAARLRVRKEQKPGINVDKSTTDHYSAGMEKTERFLRFFGTIGALGKQIQKFKAFYMEEQGLKGSDLPVLLALDAHPQGLRPEEICELIQADKALVSRSLKNLKGHELVLKDPGSVYKARLYLTAKGKELTEYLEKEAANIFEQAHLAIDQQQWESFYDFCHSLTSQIELELAERQHQKALEESSEKKES